MLSSNNHVSKLSCWQEEWTATERCLLLHGVKASAHSHSSATGDGNHRGLLFKVLHLQFIFPALSVRQPKEFPSRIFKDVVWS